MGLLDSFPRQDSKRQLSNEEKLQAIRRVTELGETKASVSRMYGVPESTLRGWCKNKDKLALLSVNDRSSEPKRKSKKRDDQYEGLLMPVQNPVSPDSKKVKLDVDTLGFGDASGEVTPPAAHAHSLPRMSTYDLPSLFALYCAQTPQDLTPNSDEPLSLVKKSENSDAPSTGDYPINYPNNDSALEAIRHGEQFLRWLEGVSDPSITLLQLTQFRCLLEKVKTASFSRQIKSDRFGNSI